VVQLLGARRIIFPPSVISYLLTGNLLLRKADGERSISGGRRASTAGGSSRQGNAGYITLTQNNEVRGAAWNFRSLVYAAAASPDGTPEKAYFDWYVRQNIALWEGTVGVANTDPAHVTAYNWGVTKMQFADGGSTLGIFTRYLDNTDPVRTDGTPPRAATGWDGRIVNAP
jgi:hypothetical protein